MTVLFYTFMEITLSHTLFIRDKRVVPYDSDRTNRAHKVLLVDDDEAVRAMMSATLESKGFAVLAAASVTEALRHIATESFDVLITDLHMPNPGDGFTVVTAMRHSQPKALTLIVSGYPDVQSAMATILLEADEIMVKPFEIAKLAESSGKRCLSASPPRAWKRRESARYCAAALPRCRRLVSAGKTEQGT